MTQPESPKPMRADAQVPQELRRALDSLRDGRVDAARIERVAAQLSPLFEGAPPSLWGYGRAKTLATKLVIATIAVGTPVFLLVRMNASEPARAPELTATAPAIEPAAEAPVEDVAVPEAEQSETAPQTQHGREMHAARAREERDQRSTDRVRDRRQSSERGARSKSARSTTSTSTTNVATANEVAATARVESPPAAPVAPEAPPAAEPPKPPAPTAAVDAGAPRLSETELLLAAHQRLREDPKAVLRLVAEHEARYPRGLLVPEREVLAIEALRKLDREGEATARSNRLRERYPEYFKHKRERSAASEK